MKKSIFVIVFCLMSSGVAIADSARNSMTKIIDIKMKQDQLINEKTLGVLLNSYGVQSTVDLFRQVLNQRDQVLKKERSPQLKKMVANLTGNEMSVDFVFSYANEGLIITTTFEDISGFCAGNRSIYTIALVLNSKDQFEVWKYGREKIDARGGVCAG